jgi:hypothetical protein
MDHITDKPHSRVQCNPVNKYVEVLDMLRSGSIVAGTAGLIIGY